jgi:predicted transcriptional regulator
MASLQRSIPLKEIQKILSADVLLDEGWLRGEIQTVYCSDLMSDILSFGDSSSLLITSLINPQTIRTAEMVDIAAICFVHGKTPHQDTIEMARNNEIVLLSTKYSMYEACGRLYCARMSKSIDLP